MSPARPARPPGPARSRPRPAAATGARAVRRAAAPLVLAPGDLIDVVSPSFAVRPERLAAGVRALESRGFRVRVAPHALEEDGYLAGHDDARLDDLQAALDATDSRAVWFSRGGYGVARLIDRLRLRALQRRPKLLVGHSDLTVLLLAAARVLGGCALHGPFASELGEPEAFDEGSLAAMLSGRAVTLALPPEAVLAQGRASGPLVGGNLTVLAHALGTRFAPRTRGAVLLLEDVGEEAYRLDRLLHHLRLAGVFDGVRAVLIGSLTAAPTRRAFPPDRDLDAVLADVLLPLRVPVARGLPLGHLPGKWTVPLLGRALVDTREGRIVFDPRPPTRPGRT